VTLETASSSLAYSKRSIDLHSLRAIERLKLPPGLFPELAKGAPGRSEYTLVFRPDGRCRGRQQHDLRGFDKSLRHSAMSVLKPAKQEHDRPLHDFQKRL
jgi:hypothetical protein